MKASQRHKGKKATFRTINGAFGVDIIDISPSKKDRSAGRVLVRDSRTTKPFWANLGLDVFFE